MRVLVTLAAALALNGSGTPNATLTYFLGSPFSGQAGGGLCALDSEGRTIRLTDPSGIRGASWSPDGRLLAFYRVPRAESGFPADIWVSDPNGHAPKNLTSGYTNFNVDPDWSPDGTRIVFVARSDRSRLVTMNADGSDKRTVAGSATSSDGVLSDPAWSPDGKWIAYQLTELPAPSGVVVIPAAGGMPHLVAADSGGADWSPDSNEIVYGMSGTGIYVVNRDGTGTRLLHASDAGNVSEYDPSWSPDGRSLAFVRYVWKPVRAESVLMLMSADGTNARRAAGDWELGASEPAWRPARAADHGRPCFVRGSTRANRLVGTNAGDVLLGEGGNDILSGRGGNDLILGGPGHDVVRGGAGADWLYTPDDARDDVEGGTGYDRAEIDDKDKSSGVEQERPPW